MIYSDVYEAVNTEILAVSSHAFRGTVRTRKQEQGHRDIIVSLILAIFQDLRQQQSANIDIDKLGWRNKYNIHLMSGVSQKTIYNEYGILEKLMVDGIVERRSSQSRWGQQKYQYRLVLDSILSSFEANVHDSRSQ